MEIAKELKDKLKEQRMSQYQRQMFTLQMDIVALNAIGDTSNAEKSQKSLEDLQKAYTAVEVM